MIKLYGPMTSRVLMDAWALDETGTPWENVPLNPHKGETRTPEYLAINPTGKVPALVDGDVVMFESIAIALYVAQTYGQGTLWPADAPAQARNLQWAFFAATALEPTLVTLFGQKLFTPPEQRKQDRLEEAEAKLPDLFGVLNQALGDSAFLAGEEFTVADLVVTAVMKPAVQMIPLDTGEYANLQRWTADCCGREAFRHFQESLDALADRVSQGLPPQR